MHSIPLFQGFKFLITSHCLQRYCERIRLIKPEHSMAYVKVHKKKLVIEIIERFKKAEKYNNWTAEQILYIENKYNIKGHMWSIKHNKVVFIIIFDKINSMHNIVTTYTI